jgi:hypothetical protein
MNDFQLEPDMPFKPEDDETRENDDAVYFNLAGRLINSLRGRGIPSHELEAVINATLGQITTMAVYNDVIMFPDGSRFIYQSGPKMVIRYDSKK